MMRRLLIALALVLLPAAVSAQSQYAAEWSHLNSTLSTVQTWAFALSVDGVRQTLTATCTQVGTRVDCRAPVANWTPAPHKVILIAGNSFGESASDELAGSPPPKPGTPRITVTVNVTVGP